MLRSTMADPHAAGQAVGRVNRNALSQVKVDRGEDDVAEGAYSIGSSEIGQAHAPGPTGTASLGGKMLSSKAFQAFV